MKVSPMRAKLAPEDILGARAQLKAERDKLKELLAWLEGQGGCYGMYLERPKLQISMELGMMNKLIKRLSSYGMSRPASSNLPSTGALEFWAMFVSDAIRLAAEDSLAQLNPRLASRYQSLSFPVGRRTIEDLQDRIVFDSPELTGVSAR
jgi:hypothetical protein